MKDSIDKIRHEPPKIRIGKNGITEGIVQEVNMLLRRDQIVKIKCLKAVPNSATKAIAENIAKLTKSTIVDVRGKTFILTR
ncbi:MAG: YhbY family RNA-binding protein [Candidatus Heimdallarchaeota archaeon]|jgi:RNA-binding protein|nr:YhbY family RNA-binding protein [Candidatus Heimdallarchaeota archaeon]MCK4254713.1 YhbY family RNA-binding protein [Candidatus Heimdallarchaeota archaeon]